jgi:predicted CopG family antitoxin
MMKERRMKMEQVNISDVRRQLRSFCRRNRSSLKKFGSYSAEEISDLVLSRLGCEEVKRIVDDIQLIDRRGGNTGFYLILILEALKSSQKHSSEERAII